eukprot:m.234237 g.234237  ORF g.234237 m.234237 type:complete len:597 (-) comp19314_c0_seq1:376-2166(-)
MISRSSVLSRNLGCRIPYRKFRHVSQRKSNSSGPSNPLFSNADYSVWEAPPPPSSSKIVVGMSGGVDSTVAAHLLKSRGYKVIGVHMRNWDEIEESGHCTSVAEYERVQRVCEHLDIDCTQVDFIKEYWNHVFEEFLRMYKVGLTPNPDSLCNQYIKFDAFLRHAVDRLGADYIATGHYCNIGIRAASANMPSQNASVQAQHDQAEHVLLRGADRSKDQSYFLAGIPSEVLRQTLFPVGNLPKAHVKDLARGLGLEQIANQKESMGICFIGKRRFRTFLQQYAEDRPVGKKVLITATDNASPPPARAASNTSVNPPASVQPPHHPPQQLGPGIRKYVDNNVHVELLADTHDGVHLYTLGQRASVMGQPQRCFVAGKDIANNVLYVVRGGDSPYLLSSAFDGVSMRWTSSLGPPWPRPPEGGGGCSSGAAVDASRQISPPAPDGGVADEMRVNVQTRYRQRAVPCVVGPNRSPEIPSPTHMSDSSGAGGAVCADSGSVSNGVHTHVGYVPTSLRHALWHPGAGLPDVTRSHALPRDCTTPAGRAGALPGKPSDGARFSLTSPLRAVTPGQTVAVYDAEFPDVCLGGGMIHTVVPTMP